MRTFKLGAVEFKLMLDAPKMLLIRSTCQLDLAATNCSQFEKLSADPVLAQTVLWRLCESQAKDVGMTEAAFFELLAGDGGEQAGEQLFEAIIDFFPKGRKRDAIRAMLAANLEAEELISQQLIDRISEKNLPEAMAAKALEEFDRHLDAMLGTPSSSAIDSPE